MNGSDSLNQHGTAAADKGFFAAQPIFFPLKLLPAHKPALLVS
ncbi:hypothetical protein [Bacillus sp. OV322]|nr:hypothetical protein [Bacillus sp. OV322]